MDGRRWSLGWHLSRPRYRHDGPVSDPGLVVSRSLTIPTSELSWRFSRSSGPGGQSVNTTDSRVELSWDIGTTPVLTPTQRERLTQALAHRLVDGVLTVTAQEHRAQLRNRQAAAVRLAAVVREALRPVKSRRPTKPTRASQRRRIDSKKRRGQTKALRKPPAD